ncbi:MAG: zinc-dependent metalloprotease [Chromatiales bacterium]|nr:zinc-dependent metalloprotease [Chromatiales bacterium]
MRNWFAPALLAVLLSSAGCGNGKETGTSAPAEDEAEATVESLTENSDRSDGMFTLFRDQDDGTVRMLIPADRLDKEYVYNATIRDAPLASGQWRGNTGIWTKNGTVRIERDFGKIRFVEENVSFHFDPDSPLSRASEANISPAVLAVVEIEAQTDDGAVLIDVGPVFQTEAFVQLKPSPNPNGNGGAKFDLGTLSGDKTRFAELRAYPQNLDLFVDYVYENPAPVDDGGEEVTDARFVTMRVQHSLIQVPDNEFRPRSYDPRVGYYLRRVTDLTSTSAAPWLDYINRWHLQKKEPGAVLSEPVEPIVFWIENTTPVEYRDTIAEATLVWNEAFEQAGFKNAVQVKIQPDDADWDAGDIRYNVLRWASSPTPAFSGFGPVFVNPRTSQIIGADIMLEHSAIKNYLRSSRIFDSGVAAAPTHSPGSCLVHEGLQMNHQVGRVALRARGAPIAEEEELLRQSLIALVMHEVGHALGLNHNFIGTQMLSPEQLADPQLAETVGTTSGSVMDYAAINLAPDGQEQGLYYEVRPGPYDRWVIEYGYSQAQEDVQAEQARLDAILARSTERALWFANDGDDMRSPGAGIDPRVMIYDLSDDAITYAADRMTLIRGLYPKLPEKFSEAGETWQEMVAAYMSLIGQYRWQAAVVSRYVGGVYVDRAVQGQSGATEPYRPVPVAEQRRALATLGRYVFAADAFAAPESLYRRLQTQRRDFDFGGKTEDPKIHAQALAVQKTVLDHLLHPVVMKRLTDSSLYGNEYRVSDMITDLTDAVFDADLAGNVNGFRQNLQSEYVGRLVKVIAEDNAGDYDQPSRAMALYTLQDLRRLLSAKRGGDVATRAHTAALVHTIDKALETG